ncbi:hypothetical protein M9H77_30226 [Catharanthus roseus]|uniref:Uncharacterized protein n=1 Tax=Catharanthus roseus TaxID=4058 RepID=A0ACB9ZYP9_CATRO|nr:hypothetical protein M9H77_30226 [Catharanthus roseus]
MKEAFSLCLQKLQYSSSFKLDYKLFVDVLKSCATTLDINLGKALHSQVIKLGHGSCQLVSKGVLNMYAKCKAIDDCQKFFRQMQNSDTVMWNIVLTGFVGSHLHDPEAMTLFREMHSAQDPKLSSVTLAIILPVCTRYGGLNAGKSVHCYATKLGLESDTLVGNALMSMYAKSGLILDASSVFRGIVDKDVISWNAIIAGLVENELIDDAFGMFQRMMKCQEPPNYATIANILPLCACIRGNDGYYFAKEIQAYVLRRAELATEITVSNALLIFYLRVGRMSDAEILFNRMEIRDLVSWNSIISGFTLNGEWLKALELFHALVRLDKLQPDSITLLGVLPACGNLYNLQAGEQIHGYMIRHSVLHADTAVQNALISFYTRCGNMGAALRLFLYSPKRDLISWNSILDASSKNKPETQFIDLLDQMFKARIRPDYITILTVVQFCTVVSRVDKVKETHAFTMKNGFSLGNIQPTLWNALLDAYAKCGNLEYACKLFENLPGKKNVVTCNSMISGYIKYSSPKGAEMVFQKMSEKDLTTWNLMVKVYAENNCPGQAQSLFLDMQRHGLRPDAMTIMSILPVCAQTTSVRMLKQCHGYLIRGCFDDIHLEGALLDVYSRCGSISSSYKLFKLTTPKDLVLFTAMIGGLAMHGLGEEAVRVYNHMLELGLKPDHVIITTVLSACSHAGLVDEGLKIFLSVAAVHSMIPSMEQYACMVDLLARGGRINEAYSFVTAMPIEATTTIWGTLLGACKIHNDVDMARFVADRLFDINSTDIRNYVAMSNLYAANARWEGVQEMRRLMRMRDLKKPAGCSWIEVDNAKHIFIAGDCSHHQRGFIYRTLKTLDQQIKDLQELYT